MPLTAAAGCISLPEEILRASLADCYYFRRWQGAAWSQAEALARIYPDALPPPTADGFTLAELTALRPFVLLWTEPQAGFRLHHDSSGSDFFYNHSGKLSLLFEQAVPDAIKDDPAEVDRRFKNEVGLMICSRDGDKPGLCELSGQGGYLAIEELVAYGPFRSAQDDLATDGDTQQFLVEIKWGQNA